MDKYPSAEVIVDKNEDKVVVEIRADKIIRIVALRGYIETVERHEFGTDEKQNEQPKEPGDEEEKKGKKKQRKKKRKGEKRAETLKERVRILRIFNNILIKYPTGYKVKVEGRRGSPSPVPINLAISWVKDIIRKLELDTDDDVEVFEKEIEENLDKFDPVMKDLLESLLDSWRKYKVRKGVD